MAGPKSPRTKEDKTKKRKRDAVDGDAKSKRHRLQKNGQGVEGSGNGPLLKLSEQVNGSALQDGTSYRPHEVIRQTDDGESGWKISQPMGGRMLDIDPILTEDEQ